MDISKLELYREDQLHSVITFEHQLTMAQADRFAAGYTARGYRTFWRPLHLRDTPQPIDLSWVTTEPSKPVWPVWRGIAVVGGIPVAFVAAVMFISWLVTR